MKLNLVFEPSCFPLSFQALFSPSLSEQKIPSQNFEMNAI